MSPIAWFDELVVDPLAHPVAMGVRALGERPWLISDENHAGEMRTKAELLASHRHDVLYTSTESAHAANAVCALIEADRGAPLMSAATAEMHPIERAARTVQEDLCLLQRRRDGWFLDASCLCAPTRWRLRSKVDQHIAQVHGPVRGYDERIARKVDQLFDRLSERPVWRRNWFLMTDPTLYQPDRPEHEEIIPAEQVHARLLVRSERQTLRLVDDGWVLFTIRIQQAPLGDLLTTDERTDRFANWVANVSDDFGARRHLTAPQRAPILAALDHRSADQ